MQAAVRTGFWAVLPLLGFPAPMISWVLLVHLATLRDLYSKIRALGGELLVLSNDPVRSLNRLAEKLELPFSLVHDAEYNIARPFGIYSENAPLWQCVAGISDDVFLPAAYVIGRHRRIAFDFVDEDLDQPLSQHSRELLTAVYALK